MLGRSITHSKQVGINIGKVNHPVPNPLQRSERGFLSLIEGLNELRGLKKPVSASRTVVETRVVWGSIADVKREFSDRRAYG